ncbi:hypothetical protein GS416_10230 [Rhodococcus hoagii]|nr:hypothetical protein [Prescottella equi]
MGVSNVTAEQVVEAQGIGPIVCVQNMYNLTHRYDDVLIDQLAEQGIAYVPSFRWAGSRRCSPKGSRRCRKSSRRRRWRWRFAWLLQRSRTYC